VLNVRNTAIPVLALAPFLALAGCGGTTPAASPRPATTQSPTPPTPATPATPGTTEGPARLTRDRCADLVVLGLRGQGQSRHAYDGTGKDVDGVARAMLPHLRPGTTVRIEGVPFPARSGGDATYASDVRTGVRLVRDRSSTLTEQCPRSHTALVGYSQGAEVVHRSAAALADPSQVVVVVLMGDPQRDPEDPVKTLRMGPGALTGRGNGGAGARFPAPIGARVLEVCATRDDVCNAPPAGRVGPPSMTHRTTYKTRRTQHRVAEVAARLAVGAGV
jgi:hypothetical protein